MGSKALPLPATLELHNRSEWDENYLRQVVEWIITDLELTGRIKFWFMTVWMELTDEGELVPGTERDYAHDGDWTEGGIIKVVISDQITYPHVWDINPTLPGFYLRKTNTFWSAEEFFIYYAAHELRHEWQEQNPKALKKLHTLLKADDETDADIYATLTLARFRAAAAASQQPVPVVENKLHPYLLEQREEDAVVGYAFWCPGCASVDPKHGLHVFTVSSDAGEDEEWSFDGVSTFEPSLAYELDPACHLHLTQGWLRYYPDCSHPLAGQVVAMVPVPAGDHEERD